MDVSKLPFPILRRRTPSVVKGWLVSILSYTCFILAFISTIILSEYLESINFNKDNGLYIVLAVMFFFMYLWNKFRIIGKKIRAPDIVDILGKDQRLPILYLRSFDDDDNLDVTDRMSAAGPVRYEEMLSRSLKSLGPMVAIGIPGEKLPLLGATRLYVGDKYWQQAVHFFMEKSVATMIVVNDGKGLWWEIYTAIDNIDPRRLIFYFPFIPSKERWYFKLLDLSKTSNYFAKKKVALLEEDRQKKYELFKTNLCKRLPVTLPESLGGAQFMDFDKNWEPRLLESIRPSTFTNISQVSKVNKYIGIIYDKTLKPFINKFNNGDLRD